MTAPTRPAIRYYGGKWRVAPWIIAHFPPHRQYIEPFGGAASVLLQKPRSYGEIYNDRYGDVVNVFRVLQDPELAAELRRRCELTPFARAEFNRACKPTRDRVDRARRTIVRSFMGFGSAGGQGGATGFRYNSNRTGTTPAKDWSRWPAQIIAFTRRLQGVVIEHRPALRVIAEHDRPDALFYVDPPYVFSTRGDRRHRKTRGRYRHEMSDDDHRALAAALHAACGMVVLSGYHSPLYDELYGDWVRDETETRADNGSGHRIGRTGTRRTEVLWLNAPCSNALRTHGSQLHLEAVGS